jgi:hypothetical protein
MFDCTVLSVLGLVCKAWLDCVVKGLLDLNILEFWSFGYQVELALGLQFTACDIHALRGREKGSITRDQGCNGLNVTWGQTNKLQRVF